MLDDMRKYVKFGLQALSSQGSEDAAEALRSRAQGMTEHVSALAAGFLEWSTEARASLMQELRALVARQVQDMGVATKEDVERLNVRLGKLEAKLGAGRTRSGAAAKGAKRPDSASAAKKAGAGRIRTSAPRASRGSR